MKERITFDSRTRQSQTGPVKRQRRPLSNEQKHKLWTNVVFVALILFCHLRYPRWLKAILLELGHKSMAMWMIHTWLAYYLFRPQVYSLRYPVLIFLLLIVVSYILAIPVMWVARAIYQRIFPNK